ncbi:MAG: ADP-ribosylglycohydrolase family protein [Chloroflexota bacterium]
MNTNTTLYDKLYACNAMGTIANSMGDVTEGMTWRQIEERYGFVDTLLPQEKSERIRKTDWGPDFHYQAHSRPPGMTEDGQERHRLMCEAIIRKGGRVTVMDVARTWLDLIDPQKFGYLLGPQDQVILMSLQAGIPPQEVGRHAVWPGFIGTAKMIEPVGLVNACNPRQAALDAHDVGRLKDVAGRAGNYALEVAAGIAAGVAEASKPGATVGGVIDTVLSELSSVPRKEVEDGLRWAREHGDWKALRPLYDERYRGRPISNAVEILSSALAVFYLADGDPKECVLAAVNFGRDCDCRAYTAGGLAGALWGSASIPRDWIETVEAELPNDPYTVSRRSLKDTADGLYQATLNTLREAKQQVELIEALL